MYNNEYYDPLYLIIMPSMIRTNPQPYFRTRFIGVAEMIKAGACSKDNKSDFIEESVSMYSENRNVTLIQTAESLYSSAG